MKKVIWLILLGGASLILIATSLLSYSIKRDEKVKRSSSLDKAREAKAKRKELIPEAESLGIDHYGKPTDQLEIEIENLKSENDGNKEKEILHSEDNTQD